MKSQGMKDVIAERERQVATEGWTAEHDDHHAFGEMARAAMSYIEHTLRHRGSSIYSIISAPWEWPWARQWWKPKEPRRDLVRAAALIIAEIDKLDRANTNDKAAA